MWNRQEIAEQGSCECIGGFAGAITCVALTTGILLATATFALAAADRDNNPPDPSGGHCPPPGFFTGPAGERPA